MTDKHDIILPGTKGDIVIAGFTHDEGVGIYGGRPGARLGPERFRYHIHRFGSVHNPQMNVDLTQIAIADAGDIPTGGTLAEAHANLTQRAKTILANGGIPFVVGGGNDQSYPNAVALMDQNSGRRVGVINVDAHLDVRPLKENQAHSGSPFRLLLEDDRFDGRNFIEFAAQGSQCSREHADYVRARSGHIFWLDEARQGDCMNAFRECLGKLAWRCSSIFVSFDLDAICGTDAPGVSCPGIVGLSAREALMIAYIAGTHPQVSLFDLSEYNPEVEEYRTGRLAAGIFYYFCLGVASRTART